jgi:predicted metal-dependent hydrolase
MSGKSEKIAGLIERFKGAELDPHYLGFLECFNRQLFYEAHEVLEELWLARRTEPDASFYKGLIQLAGAFVHLQKGRARPAVALFKLAQMNLKQYPPMHHGLKMEAVLAMIGEWVRKLKDTDAATGDLVEADAPELRLQPG